MAPPNKHFLLILRITVKSAILILTFDPCPIGLTMHASILAYMFSIVETNKITVPIGSNQGTVTNELYIKDFTASLLKSAFPHLQE